MQIVETLFNHVNARLQIESYMELNPDRTTIKGRRVIDSSESLSQYSGKQLHDDWRQWIQQQRTSWKICQKNQWISLMSYSNCTRTKVKLQVPGKLKVLLN